MQKWEYKVLIKRFIGENIGNRKENKHWWNGEGMYWEDDYANQESFQSRLNEVGEEGWELIQFQVHEASMANPERFFFFLKRPKPSP